MSRRLSFILLSSLLVFSATQARTDQYPTAIFAGGCFWCMEADFEKLPGVVDVVSGYSGGKLKDPTYEQVSSGATGHLEVVEVSYDPKQIDYSRLLDYYWRHIDPTRDDGQFCDQGAQYRPAIFYQGEEQKRLVEASHAKIEQTKPFTDEIRVELSQAGPFYPAEAYHQDYYKKNPIRYRFYRYSCGRDERVKQLWGSE
jgi:peptide-methionine (S)-S-oxide reductase